MSFILFLIFGGFLLLALCADKGAAWSAESNAKRRQSERQRDFELWIPTVTDNSLEMELQDFIYYNTSPRSKKKSDAHTVGWMSQELKDKLNGIPDDVLQWCVTRRNILILLMARQGKIPRYIAECGIDCLGDNCTTPGRRAFQIQQSAIVWIDTNLQRHGVEPMLFQKIHQPLQKTDFARDRTEAHVGKYCWWTGRRYYDPIA